MKHYFCFLVLSVLLLIPIDTYASSQAISLKVGETKTVSLPRDVTSKKLMRLTVEQTNQPV